ncbi:MAG: PAS domain S-box protein [Methanobacteriaceae archaeon]|nr:PAS domain S-box protein [Methanobacteriaceae archaeon]
MKFDVFDANKNFVTGEYFENFTDLYKPSRKVELVPKFKYDDLFLKIDYGISVYRPYHDGEDFLIQHLSPTLMEQCGLTNEDDVRGCLFSEVFPLYTKNNFLEFLREAYKKQTSLNFELYGYTDDGVFFKHYIYDVVGTEDAAFILAKDDTDFLMLKDQENRLFENSPYGLAIFQDGKLVRVNTKFQKLLNIPLDYLKIDKLEIKDIPLVPTKLTKEELIENYQKILNNELLKDHDVMSYTNYKGEHFWFDCVASLTNYEDNKAVQITLLDITESKDAQDEAFRIQKSLKLVESNSKFSIVNYNKNTGFIVTDEFFKILETEPFDLRKDIDKFYQLIDNQSKWDMINHLNYMVENQIEDDNFQFEIDINGKVKHLMFYSKIIDYEEDGSASDYVGYLMDITESVEREQKLAEADKDKAVLLKEIHHRVKNNLQIILSLISLDERFNKQDYEMILDSTKSRIKSMALIHQKTYESDSLSNINVRSFMEDYCLSILNLYNLEDDINLIYNIDEYLELPLDIMTPLSLILNEFVTNSIKYAFSNSEDDKNIILSMDTVGDMVNFTIEDNGVGLPEDLDVYNSPSLGLTIINSLTNQINGEFSKIDCEGAGFKLKFPANFES